MDRLWAPWREAYVTAVIQKKSGCIFCAILKERQDRRNLIFTRSAHSFAVLNLYPYNNGHSLIVPARHVNDLDKLRPEERLDFFDLMSDTKRLLQAILKPDGFNIGINLGRVAGAGVPGHVHMHVVPRWKGDVNFMPVVNGTRVISQSMKALFQQLKKAQRDF
jgi:ATP adenylyltransferase